MAFAIPAQLTRLITPRAAATLDVAAPMLPDPDAEQLERLVALLLSRGLVDAADVERARPIAQEKRLRLDRILTQLGLVSERALAESFAALLELPVAAAAGFPTAPVLPERLKAKFLRHARILPIAIEDVDTLRIAMADPLDHSAISLIAAATRMTVAIAVAVPIELEAALERLYPDQETALDTAGVGNEASDDDAERLKDLASEAPIIRLVNQIIGRAVETSASDIHIEPFEGRLRVRYRYDGVLHEAEAPSAQSTNAIISRIKIMARLDIAERRLPQDGRLTLAVRGQDVDFRVSTIPSLYGETVVLRILDRTAVEFDYSKLGLPSAIIATLRTVLNEPNGMVLVTGPTGSGKTTTLYTALGDLNSIERKIVTVEDPVEFQLFGINQIHVRPQIGLTFATLLRSILRQDPDVIMVGEIRDLETAQISTQAALTGHLVLSTLHTNSAATAITRLRDMGLEDYLLTAVLKGVLAQRLVRRVCPACSVMVAAPKPIIDRFDLTARCGDREPMIPQAVGCPECRHTGFKGREAVAEILIPNGEVEALILSGANHTAIEKAAVAGGMKTMFDYGLDAVLDGRTTLDEVIRSVRSEG